ncbi:hypothetical protein IMZ31_22210 (plasmid) [Pontibacillus sp. ALD_SL1]|uniref:hypothetical protein n=1 Tax=Pontibacillus sp. ALD_SL1 TaxID=2777185 RepID=UPI001A9785F5|nr:hypothetical protein [Pontibacillus sp. ALD_SL1]QST02169.1 hypothetical protein IMZ31_22210 [Pontibacillus sp. ALD_SL1]
MELQASTNNQMVVMVEGEDRKVLGEAVQFGLNHIEHDYWHDEELETNALEKLQGELSKSEPLDLNWEGMATLKNALYFVTEHYDSSVQGDVFSNETIERMESMIEYIEDNE